MKSPLVSVIMPVRNAAPFVAAAIRSVLGQTMADLELLVIDDVSADGSMEVIAAFDDSRLHCRRGDVPRNAGSARNLALAEARGEFVAFLDADDFAEPDRLAVQIAALRARPDTGVAASLITSIDDAGTPRGPGFVRRRRPEEIAAVLLFENCLALSSVTARRAVLRPFRADMPLAEDYDLWVHLAAATKFFIVPRALTRYRTHAGGVSAQQAGAMRTAVASIHAAQLARLGLEPAPIHGLLSAWPLDSGVAQLSEAEEWLRRLGEANDRLAVYAPAIFRAELARRWFQICLDSWMVGWPVWRIFRHSPLAAPTLDQRVRLLRRLVPRLFRR